MNLKSYVNEHLINSIVSIIKEGKGDDVFSYKSIEVDIETFIDTAIENTKNWLSGNVKTSSGEKGKKFQDNHFEEQLYFTNTGWKKFIDGETMNSAMLNNETGEVVKESAINYAKENKDYDSIRNYLKFLGVDIENLEGEDEKETEEKGEKPKAEEENKEKTPEELAKEKEAKTNAALLLLNGKKLVKDDQGNEKEEALSSEEQKLIRGRILAKNVFDSYYNVMGYERTPVGKSARKILPKLCSLMGGIGSIGEFHAMLTAIYLKEGINLKSLDLRAFEDSPLYALLYTSTENEQENNGVFIAIMLLAIQNSLALGLNENDITKLFSLTGLFCPKNKK